MNRLFMLVSIDGKISGVKNDADFDIYGNSVKEYKKGMAWYYNLESQTDLYSLNSLKVMRKMRDIKGPNFQFPHIEGLTLIVIDSKTNPVKYEELEFMNNNVVLFTNNTDISPHGVISEIYKWNINELKKYASDKDITVQVGGTLQAYLLKNDFIDIMEIVTIPVVVGTDGVSLFNGVFDVFSKFKATHSEIKHGFVCVFYKKL